MKIKKDLYKYKCIWSFSNWIVLLIHYIFRETVFNILDSPCWWK